METIDDFIISFALFVQALVELIVIKPIVLLAKGAYWIVVLYPRQSLITVFVACCVLIGEKLLTGNVNLGVFAAVFVVVMILVVAMVAVMVTPERDSGVEFAPLK